VVVGVVVMGGGVAVAVVMVVVVVVVVVVQVKRKGMLRVNSNVVSDKVDDGTACCRAAG